uniref:Uncharacterized protein n=1 Tax=Arundo donax TaxID=35708 RepID=A0A0A8ZSC4_ARUDO
MSESKVLESINSLHLVCGARTEGNLDQTEQIH